MNETDAIKERHLLHSDNHLIAVNKPSGLSAQPDVSGDLSLFDKVKEYIRVERSKPGDVYLALLHRLDRPTSGIVLLARTGKAAGRMSELFRNREIEKRYIALVECATDPGVGGRLTDILAPLTNGGMRIVAGKAEKAKEARLTYRTIASASPKNRALLEIELETGVKHQIRCQLAGAGLPIVGDFRYGPRGKPARPEAVAKGRAILLHAWRTAFVHPVRRERLEISAPLPAHWRPFLDAMPDAMPALAALGAATAWKEPNP